MSISATVTYKINDKLDNLINKVFDAGIGVIAKELVEKSKDDVAVDTGALKKSIRQDKIKELEWRFISGGPKVPYAVLQELGHLQGFKYKFTPFMRPAVISLTGNTAIMDEAFANKLKGTSGFAESAFASSMMSSFSLRK